MFTFLVRFKNGLIMAGVSARYMFQRPKLLFFPLLRVLLFSSFYGLLFSSFIGLLIVMRKKQDLFSEKALYLLGMLVVIAWFFLTVYISFCIMLFSSVATIDYLWNLFQGKMPSIRQSLGVACKRIPIILLWSGVHTGVRLYIVLINGGKDDSSWRKIVAGATDVAWAVSTYFVVPIIAEKRMSLIETLKASSQLMKQKFGEVVGVAVSFQALAGLIFPGIICIVIMVMNYVYDSGQGREMAIDFYKYPDAYVILIGVFFVTVILRVFITSAQDIFKAAVFSYVHGKATGPFSSELIDQSFETK